MPPGFTRGLRCGDGVFDDADISNLDENKQAFKSDEVRSVFPYLLDPITDQEQEGDARPIDVPQTERNNELLDGSTEIDELLPSSVCSGICMRLCPSYLTNIF